MPYALCPMSYVLCPMSYSLSSIAVALGVCLWLLSLQYEFAHSGGFNDFRADFESDPNNAETKLYTISLYNRPQRFSETSENFSIGFDCIIEHPIAKTHPKL